jgi:hypothetical protein
MEVNLSIQMSAKMVGVGEHLSVGAIGRETFEILQLQWLIRWPWRCSDTERDCQINEFHGFAPV